MGRVGMDRANQLIWGFFFIAIGGLLLAANLGWMSPRGIWSYWPFLLMAMGSAKLLFGGNAESAGNGFWLVLAGLYGWISIWNIWGLHWGTAWPIFVIAGGLSLLFKPASFGCGRSGRGGHGGDGGSGVQGANHVV